LEGVQKITKDNQDRGLPAEIKNGNLPSYAIYFEGNCSSTRFRTLAKEKGYYLPNQVGGFFFNLYFLLPGIKSNVKGITNYTIFFLLWRCDPTRSMASSFLRFLDHTQRRTAVGRTPLDEWSARRRDLYL